ncbi:MAG: hypothetical protein A3D92_11260 [Bacteroidetes bacterium RIFCSPHIGHO2_02_FULL_44_7]|nr:MAG: hypothetical protein A3D92_11260 [Bacteroidetes bacterium RIFCSPHIGHO2_02_FULL_44_7]
MHTQNIIGKLMFISILISVAILLCAEGLLLWHHGHEIVHEQIFHTEPQRFIQFSQIWQGVLAFHVQSLLMLGIVFVIAGQALRVFFTGVIFSLQRDWIFAAISLTIFVILLSNAF